LVSSDGDGEKKSGISSLHEVICSRETARCYDGEVAKLRAVMALQKSSENDSSGSMNKDLKGVWLCLNSAQGRCYGWYFSPMDEQCVCYCMPNETMLELFLLTEWQIMC